MDRIDESLTGWINVGWMLSNIVTDYGYGISITRVKKDGKTEWRLMLRPSNPGEYDIVFDGERLPNVVGRAYEYLVTED